MERVICRAAALTLGAIIASACGSASTSSIAGPSAAKCQVSVSGGNTSFPAQGGSGGFTVSTTRDCSWSAQSTVGWIHLGSNSSGQGEASVSFAVDANPVTADRSGQIVVSAESFSVSQAAAPPPPPPPPPAPSPAPAPGPSPSPAPSPGTGVKVDIDGKVTNLSGACPTLRFILDGSVVTTTSSTDFRKMKCTDVSNGAKLTVTGEVQLDGTVLASKVERD